MDLFTIFEASFCVRRSTCSLTILNLKLLLFRLFCPTNLLARPGTNFVALFNTISYLHKSSKTRYLLLRYSFKLQAFVETILLYIWFKFQCTQMACRIQIYKAAKLGFRFHFSEFWINCKSVTLHNLFGQYIAYFLYFFTFFLIKYIAYLLIYINRACSSKKKSINRAIVLSRALLLVFPYGLRTRKY